MKKQQVIADVSLLLVTFIWGSTFVLVQNAVALLEPFTFNGVRFGLAGLFLIAWLFVFKRNILSMMNKKLLLSGVIMGTWLFTAYALQTFGLLHTTSSKAGFITGLSVVLVPLFGFLFLKETPKRFAVFGVGVATIGLYLLTLGDSLALNFGDILVFFCAISFAAHIVVTGKYTPLYSTLLLTIVQIFTVSVLSSISAVLFEDWQRVFDSEVMGNANVFLALIICSIFATALAFLAQTNFQKFTTPTRVALIFAMEPVFAAITGFFWANERLGSKALLGCLLIFIGMILAELPQKVFDGLVKNKQSYEAK
ncbi:DMT(drug/metabolite transporter) superfamily permease [Schinkia azotoformans MEV2011]|uniref:DMT(Drug/metabolite transporter) superfamily permease n=1 Tax=Schinkia azotoformans MEV2011 TaxID=1348973 RepID=A0A072NJN7_SCHAZ|nr:DMT family transporter [Schinkia azotoformans]KEF37088.1 DMT(drug/metabolite transporter) superfamily permease [Schinkia azotoformans MEV2011]MEC1694312.1 DMT family transporter [Schinkia azotoformans]MEC1718033.1 DMT family transporter [Schinkia azotoformans]MEC1723405.1 DMT family transporter [Schinkia azotoformans]MEC1742781.1 DMT family transporter [Schinkia azotoformans]